MNECPQAVDDVVEHLRGMFLHVVALTQSPEREGGKKKKKAGGGGEDKEVLTSSWLTRNGKNRTVANTTITLATNCPSNKLSLFIFSYFC